MLHSSNIVQHRPPDACAGPVALRPRRHSAVYAAGWELTQHGGIDPSHPGAPRPGWTLSHHTGGDHYVAGTGIRRPSCGAAADGTTTATVGKVDRGAVTVGSRWADAHIYDPLAVEPSRSTQHCAAGEREPALRTNGAGDQPQPRHPPREPHRQEDGRRQPRGGRRFCPSPGPRSANDRHPTATRWSPSARSGVEPPPAPLGRGAAGMPHGRLRRDGVSPRHPGAGRRFHGCSSSRHRSR
jgi:hypothetical protein